MNPNQDEIKVGSPRGRDAARPTDIPKRGWIEIAGRVKREAKDDAVTFYAAGVAFYLLLALAPSLAAVAGIYGLVVDRARVVDHVQLFLGILPKDIIGLLETELDALAASDSVAGWALVLGLGLALWGSSKAVEAMTIALNRVYDEENRRGFFRRKLNALWLTGGLLIFLAFVLFLLVAAPVAINFAGLAWASDSLIWLARWPVLFATAYVAVSTLYRFAPSRRSPKWRWTAPGSILATTSWVIICAGLSFYASHGGGGSKTYGSLAAVVLLMSFFYLSTLAILIGGELNAETERQTARDSTMGSDRPIDQRGAIVADTIAPSRGEKNLEQ